LPLTNCAFNKDGTKFITGSYDRTCKVWDTETGTELLSLEEHKNVVYTMAFNNPFGNLVMTGSFDKTARFGIVSQENAKIRSKVISRKSFA
jgi:dynein assembly factor with WDR repeat domains 1